MSETTAAPGTTAGGDRDTTTVDAVVLGLGPGGEIVASQLAKAGLSVVGIEAALVGGECPFWACVPSKMMLRAAELVAETRRMPQLAGSSTATPDWAPVATRISDEATHGWDDSDAAGRLEDAGCTIVRGRGRLVAPDTVEVDAAAGSSRQRFRGSRAVVIATGTRAAVPPIDGLADTPYWTNHEATETDRLPTSIIVLGGGPVGAELAQVYARFGSEVTLVEAADRLVDQEEPEAGEILAEVFARDGIDVITGATATSVSHDGRSFTISLEGGSLEGGRTLTAERLLVAAGRDTRLDDIGAIDALGVDPEAMALPVDDHLRVTDGVWAVGDVTGKGAFTHVALHQAKIVLADILGDGSAGSVDAAVPRVTFTDPEIGSVGLSVAAAADSGIDVKVGRASVPSTARGWMHGPGNDGFILLVADREREVLVGATAMGPSGGEVLGMLALAVHAEIPIQQLRTMMYAYPTFHRGVEDALRDME